MTTHFPETSRGIVGHVREFFYAEEVPYGVALMRITLPLVQLAVVLPRWWHARELFSSQGSPTPIWVAYGIPHGPIPSATLTVALISLLIVLLLTASAGWFSRFSMAAAAAIFTYLSVLDSTSTLDKCVCICAHAMFLLSMSPCGAVWSVDAWLRAARAADGRDQSPPRFPAWPRRLLQLLIGIIYLSAAATKLHMPSYFSGDQMLYWMLTDITEDHPLGKQVALYPAFIPLMSYGTLIWEIGFLFLAWRGYGRACMLGIGIVFHVLTWALLGLAVFPLTYLCLYLAWVNERDVARWSGALRGPNRPLLAWGAWSNAALSPLRRLAGQVGVMQSATGFALFLAATAFAGVEIERRRDVFGERMAGGPQALQPVAAERVAELFNQSADLKTEDKVFAFDLGSVMLGEHVVDRRSEFEYGEKAIVQCSLTPPHADLWVEFNLVDSEGRIVSRHGQVVPREQLRSSHSVTLDRNLPAGDYQWVLRLDGHDVAARPFSLGAVRTASADR
jgi:hypothetical protein